MFDDTKVQLASAVHPKFKLDSVENQIKKTLVLEQRKRAAATEHRRKEMQQDCPTAFARESNQDRTQVTAATPPSKDFFARTKRNTTIARPDADAEVESYLSDTSTELSSLEAYPDICQVT